MARPARLNSPQEALYVENPQLDDPHVAVLPSPQLCSPSSPPPGKPVPSTQTSILTRLHDAAAITQPTPPNQLTPSAPLSSNSLLPLPLFI